MSSIVVTGALGTIGRWLVRGLADDGHAVTGIDAALPDGGNPKVWSKTNFRKADLTDLGEVSAIFQRVDPDAVVHFAAIPAFGDTADSFVFDNNVSAAYSVLKSAGWVDADVVAASSEAVYGLTFADTVSLPEYVPIDESHPTSPEDEYGTAKIITEEIAAMVARRYGVQAVSLRLAWTQVPGAYDCRDVPDDEILDSGAQGLWSYVDVRDIVDAVRSALEADVDGHEAVLVAAEDNYAGMPTVDALEAYFGRTPERCDVSGRESVYSTAKARRVLGWQPSHTWRTAADESVPEPSFADE